MLDQFIAKAYTAVMKPALSLLFAIAFLEFVWGLVIFMRDKDSDKGRDTGKNHIMYGLIGMLIMVSVFGIINIITGTIGATPPVNQNSMQPFNDIDKVNVKSGL